MGKISPVSIKYTVRANIKLSGVVEKPDVIGAVFGQTEGLLGADLELRELQKSGRIGRIEVNTSISNGRVEGEILIPSSMDKSETAIIAAAIETIERVGPCTAEIHVTKIEDVRISKRNFILRRAKELLKNLVDELPDSTAITNSVSEDVRALEITEYGKDKLPAGPMLREAEEIIVVEGRADVVNLLKYGFKNVVAIGGATPNDTVIQLINEKVTTLFLDGDRGGDLILKNIAHLADVDFVARAPDGKEVEELTLKEINKALRAKVTTEQVHAEKTNDSNHSEPEERPEREHRSFRERSEPRESRGRFERSGSRYQRSDSRRPERGSRDSDTRARKPELPKAAAKAIKQMAEELVGTHGAYLLDESNEILGKVPVKELPSTVKDMGGGIFAIVVDGSADADLINLAEKNNVKFIIAKKVEGSSRAVTMLNSDSL